MEHSKINNIPQQMLKNIFLLCILFLLACSQLSVTKLMLCINHSPSSLISYPYQSDCTYTQSTVYSITHQQNVLKKEINIRQSQYSSSVLFIFRKYNQTQHAQMVQSQNKMIAARSNQIDAILTQRSDGSKMVFVEQPQHIEITIMDKGDWKIQAEYFFNLILANYILFTLFSNKSLHAFGQFFEFQFYAAIVYYVNLLGSHLLELINNWPTQEWKFILFLPMLGIVYKILDLSLHQIMGNTINYKIAICSVVINTTLLALFAKTIVYPLVCSLALLYPYKQQPEKSNSHNHLLLFTYFLLQLKIAIDRFTFQINQGYAFNLQMASISISLIYIVYLIRLLRQIHKQRLQIIKFKVKIIAKKSQLISEISDSLGGQKIEEECAICYQKIEQNWAKTACNHIFHQRCLEEWLSKSQTCPIDRRRVIKSSVGHK